MLCGTAEARSRPVQLCYLLREGAANCPDATSLKQAVTARLGFDPWQSRAGRRMEVEVELTRGGLRAQMQLWEEGRVLGRRVLKASKNDCKELGAVMALAISIAIDPQSASRHLSRAGPETPAAASRGVAHSSARARRGPQLSAPPTRPTGPQLTVGLGGLVALGTAPGPAAGGLELQVGLRWSSWSAAVDGRFDFPAFADLPVGRISALLGGGSLVGCGHYRMLFGCGVLTVAALRGAGHELLAARSVTFPYLAAGVRGGAEIPVVSRWSLRAHAELVAPFSRIRLEDSSTGAELWTTEVVSGSFALSVVSTFF